MSGRSAQAKGRRAEIELAAYLREQGLTDARPGEPLNYGKQPDITGIAGLHIECKRHEKIELNNDNQRSSRGEPGSGQASFLLAQKMQEP